MLTNIAKEKIRSTVNELSFKDDAGVIGAFCENDFPIYCANEKMATMLGYDSVDELIKGIDAKLINSVYKEDLKRVLKYLNNGNFYEGYTYKTSYRMPKKDGSLLWIINEGKVIRSEDGRLAIVSICNNITDFIKHHEELERLNNLSNSTLRSIPGGYHQCSYSEGFPFVYLSKRFLNMLGFSKEEIKNQFDNKLINMLHDDYKKMFEEHVNCIKEKDNGNDANIIFRIKSKSGYIWVSDAISAVKTNSEVFYHGAISDINKFVIENNLQKNKLNDTYLALAEMKDIISSSKMGTWSITLLNDGTCKLRADERMRELLGITDDLNEEEMYTAWYRNICEEALPSVLDSVDKMKKGLNDENTYLWNHPVLGKRYVRCGGVGHEIENGYILRGYHYDVDDMVKEDLLQHKLLKNALINEKKHTEITDTLATLYKTTYLIDLKTHTYEVVKSFNDKVKTGSTGNFDKAIDNAIKKSVVDDMKDAVRRFLYLDTLNERLSDVDTIIAEHLDIDGNWYESRFIVKNRGQNGNVLNVLYVSRDITIEKKHELDLQRQLKIAAMEAKKANISKTDFLRRMSHDIRTPLNGIIGILTLSDKFDDDSKKREEFKDKMLQSANYLLELVNDVLDISKLESGTMVLENKSFHLDNVFSRIISTVEVNAKEHNIRFEGGIKRSNIIHHWLIGSEIHLNRVLMNLASNAIKYNKENGYVRMYCNEIGSDDNFALFEFICEDNGLGMSKEFMEHAFEPFTQENKETITGFSGSGLGLSIVKDIVEKMSGTISLTSEENKGSKFVVRIPFKIDKEPCFNKFDIKQQDIDINGLKALLVEDNGLNMEIAKMVLENEGLIVTCAKNGMEALNIVKDNKDDFDLIFMDVMMPVMDGITASRKIRELGVKTPIIAMTANAFLDDKKACLDAGMNAHIAKPLDVKLIDKTIKGLLNKTR